MEGLEVLTVLAADPRYASAQRIHLPEHVVYAADVPRAEAITLPAVLVFTDTAVVGEQGIGRLLGLNRHAGRTAGALGLVLWRNSQAFRSLRLKQLLGPCVHELPDGPGLWELRR
jgi:hypothetical protein